jgi:hypothetical protein
VFGIALVVAVFAGSGCYATPGAFVVGFRPSRAGSAGLALAGALVVAALTSNVPVRRPVPVR